MKKNSNPSTTTKTKMISVRVPVSLYKDIDDASMGNRTRWLIEAIQSKLEKKKPL